MGPAQREIKLGLWENIGQFSVLVLINAFVGAMVGLERTVVSLIGEREFGLTSKTAIVSFIVSFGVVKALCNLFAARISETRGRKRVLVLGWLVGLPVPFIMPSAPSSPESSRICLAWLSRSMRSPPSRSCRAS